MSQFFDNEWAAQGRTPSWEQQKQAPPSRSGSSAMSHASSEPNAFASQFEEIERATDNLMKSGKWLPAGGAAAAAVASASPMASVRRDSMPAVSRGYEPGTDPRMGGSPRHHHSSNSEFEGGRPGSAGLQGFYAGQRFPAPRQSEAEQMLQAKRRMAAQRERELRNYHQEQQYNRNVSGAKTTTTTDRAMSPNTGMTEDDRRELIARQHRALYGDNSSIYTPGAEGSRGNDARASISGASGRGASPLAFDPFSVPQAQSGSGDNSSAVQMPPRDGVNSTTSPASNPSAQQQTQSFNIMTDAQQSSRASASSPGTSPPLQGQQKGAQGSGVAPIGTRPVQGGPGINKRSTTPLTPSSLSYGFSNADAAAQHQQQQQTGGVSVTGLPKDGRSASVASNPSLAAEKGLGGGSWAGNNRWGNTNTLGSQQASVWG